MNGLKKRFPKVKDYNWGKLTLELVVVFLGVTAGFLLNNWRSDSIDRKVERNYKIGFIQDLNKNIEDLQSDLKEDSLWMKRAEPLLAMFIKGEKFPIDSAKSAMKLIVGFNKIQFNKSTYENITNSGKLNIISDYKLKEEIVQYHLLISGVENYNDYYFSFYIDLILPYIISEYSIVNDKFINNKVKDFNRFSNVFSLSYVMIQNRQEHYKSLLTKSRSLKEQLDKDR